MLSYSLLAVLKYTVDDPLPSPCWFINSRSCAPIRLCVCTHYQPLPILLMSGLCWALLTTYSWPPWDLLSAPAYEWEHAPFLCLARLLNVMSSSSIHAVADDRALRCVVEYCSCVCSGHIPFIHYWRALRWFRTLSAVDGAALKLRAVTGFIQGGREYTRGTWATLMFSSSHSPKSSVECCIRLYPWLLPLGWTAGKRLWVNAWVSVSNWYPATLAKQGSQWPWTLPHRRSKDAVRFFF